MNKCKFLLFTPLLILLTGCQSNVSLSREDSPIAQRSVTEADVVIFPDDNPSIPDGKVVFEKMNCAQCHGASGQGTASVNLADQKWAGTRKPLEQYEFLAYGRPGVDHPVLKDKLSRRLLWDVVFYARSLATPPLSDEELGKIKEVFGSNCQVCHGPQGFGDGPLNKPIPGQAILPLEPNPANFHQFNRFFDRTDDTLFEHIADGIKWEGMPGFKGKQDRRKGVTFDDEYIRKLVLYIRAFHSSNKPTLSQNPEPNGEWLGKKEAQN